MKKLTHDLIEAILRMDETIPSELIRDAMYILESPAHCPEPVGESDAAEILGVAKSSFHRWRTGNTTTPFPFRRVPNPVAPRSLLYDAVELRAYVRSKFAGPCERVDP